MKLFYRVFTLLVFVIAIDGLKVLGIHPFGSNSHFAVGNGIVKALHKAGHEVTVISPYPQKKPLKNYRDINTTDIIDADMKENPFNPFDIAGMNTLVGFAIFSTFGNNLVNSYLNHSGVTEFLNEKQDFDVCVFEIFVFHAMLGIAEKYNCVLISYTTFGAVKWINDMTANQMPTSYVPHPFLGYTEKMSFSQRFYNTFASLFEDAVYQLIYLPNQRRLYNKYFPNAKRSFDEMYKSSAIIFMNNHVSSSSARPYLPNMIEVNGVHMEPAKPLPKNIQEFLDSADDGVILFSMGSIIQAVQWPIEKREAFVKAFGKLKQKVLWKYENETLPNKPENVMISKWIPQRDILAHPNIKVFITHGGLLGTTEALTEGVPVLGIPIFADQKMNIAKAVSQEYGLQINYEDVSEEYLSEKLTELINNPKYSENIKKISKRFNDRPMTPQESVVYWTEYAVRHNGAPHLRAAGNSLNFIEFHSIDVYAALAVIGLICLFIDYLILKFILAKFFSKKSNVADSKKNK